MHFKVGDRVRLRTDADLDGAEMEGLPPRAAGTVTGIGSWVADDDIHVEFDREDMTTRQCDPAWLELIEE